VASCLFFLEGCIVENRFYLANAETDVILRGGELKNGMRVLIERFEEREDPNSPIGHFAAKANIANRWCVVTQIEFDRYFVKFVGVYDDGTMASREYLLSSVAWIVRKDSIPVENFVSKRRKWFG
jgi:hypothetical protein